MAILADTGVLFALLDRDDSHHGAAKELLSGSREPWLVPLVVLPEVCYLAQKYLGADVERKFLEGVAAGELTLEWGEPSDLARAIEILRRRPEFGMVDAMVMAVAERLRIRKIATFDRRHFGSFKTGRGEDFELLP